LHDRQPYFKPERVKIAGISAFLYVYSSKPIFYLELVGLEQFLYIIFVSGNETDMKMTKISFCY